VGATDGNPITELGTLFELFGETSFETFGGKLRVNAHGCISF
jgi:hypothetical protein